MSEPIKAIAATTATVINPRETAYSAIDPSSSHHSLLRRLFMRLLPEATARLVQRRFVKDRKIGSPFRIVAPRLQPQCIQAAAVVSAVFTVVRMVCTLPPIVVIKPITAAVTNPENHGVFDHGISIFVALQSVKKIFHTFTPLSRGDDRRLDQPKHNGVFDHSRADFIGDNPKIGKAIAPQLLTVRP